MSPTPMQWTHLQPVTRNDGLDGGLRAEVHDPLWLLARQWQLGEFAGSDSGTPVRAVLRMDCTPVTRFVGGDVAAALAGNAAGTQLSRVEPLEALIEQERVHDPARSRLDLTLEAGLHLLRLIDPTGAAGHRAALAEAFRPPPPAGAPALVGDAGRLAGLLSGRVPDGTLLAWVVKVDRGDVKQTAVAGPFGDRVAAALGSWRSWLAGLATAERTRVATAVGEWLSWYDTLLAQPEPAHGSGTWLPDRMEYSAAVSVPGRDGETVLTVPEHVEGHLDWYSFDTVGGTLGAGRADLAQWPWTDEDGETLTRTVIPAPVTYPGMPASRYWEFEDARVDFGAVAAGAQQLAHLLLVEFALVYGDDWFLVPVDMPVGSLSHVRWLVVTDSFGYRTLIPSARSVDQAGGSTTTLPWDMFRLAPDSRPLSSRAAPTPEGLFLPPTLGTSLHGRAVEDVLLLRDDAANMAWAVERVVESATGRAFDRAEAWHRSREEPPPPPAEGAVFRYRLATDPPDHWLPLFPTRLDDDAPAVHFLRGGAPLGRILEPDRAPESDPLYLHEEEVPSEAATVTRAYQHARWLDGRTYVWMARRKGVARPQGGSGMSFDVLEPRP